MDMHAVRRVIPPLTTAFRKGQHGRVGVVGGCFEYTGAPFYAGISALKTGADLCHIFCTEEAAIPIKSYSPELIVHPLLRSDKSCKAVSSASPPYDVAIAAAEQIAKVFPRLDTLILGPGLGRDEAVQMTTRRLISLARDAGLRLVLDGDALFLVSLDPSIIRGYRNAILTPNAMEYARLCATVGLIETADPKHASTISPKDLSLALGSPVVLQKGQVDLISDGENVITSEDFGCPRRCGGQGDVLTGAIATFASWTLHANLTTEDFPGNPLILAALGGSRVTRASAVVAFARHRRAMTAPDVLECIGEGFERAFPEAT